MPHIYSDVDKLKGQPRIGSGTCVDIVKLLVPGLKGRSTLSWKEGANVMEAFKAGTTLLRGTAIATFENGRYPQHCATGYQGSCHHAGLLLSVMEGGIWILDQYNVKERPNMGPRFIRIPAPSMRKLTKGSWADAGNNALSFSVIE